jgi:hypothetical protein
MEMGKRRQALYHGRKAKDQNNQVGLMRWQGFQAKHQHTNKTIQQSRDTGFREAADSTQRKADVSSVAYDPTSWDFLTALRMEALRAILPMLAQPPPVLGTVAVQGTQDNKMTLPFEPST